MTIIPLDEEVTPNCDCLSCRLINRRRSFINEHSVCGIEYINDAYFQPYILKCKKHRTVFYNCILE